MKLQVLQSTKESIIRRKVGELTMRQLDDNSSNEDATENTTDEGSASNPGESNVTQDDNEILNI